jgi:hypothetical protein
MKYALIAAAAALCLDSAAAAANVFARADDTRVAAPEQRPARQDYSLDLSLGGSYLAGNVDHVAVAPALALGLKLGNSSLFADVRSNYTANGGKTIIDRHKGSLLYAFSLAEQWNAYAYNTHAKNAFITLDYRTTASAGLCWHSFLGTPGVVPLISAGVTPEFEWWQDGSQEQALRGTVRMATTAKATNHLRVGFDVIAQPRLTDAGDLRVYGEGFAELKITDNALAVRLTVSDEYDSRPKMSVQRHDITVVPSLVIKTGR